MKIIPISLKPSGYLSKIVKNNLTKVAILSLIFVALLPGLQIYVERDQVWQKDSVFKIGGIYETFPGGNERNLQFWLYENTEPNDLILNDLSLASSWFIGFRAQNLMNGERQNEEIRFSYDIENDEFKPKYQGTIDSLKAHKILKHPWDHEKIGEITSELDIKYIYISERERFEFHCNFPEDNRVRVRGTCYPYMDYWPWKDYSGSARIAMYENHPNLELILRNGNSAVFKVL